MNKKNLRKIETEICNMILDVMNASRHIMISRWKE